MKTMNWINKALIVAGSVLLFGFTSSRTSVVNRFVEDLSESKWYMMVWDTNVHPNAAEITFLRGGTLYDPRYDDNGKEHTWILDGNKVEFSVNDAYVTYTGELTSATTMVGKAKNERGSKWKWFAIKIK